MNDELHLLVEWSSPWEEFRSAIRPAFERSPQRLAGEAQTGLFPYRGMAATWAAEILLFVLLILVTRGLDSLHPNPPPAPAKYDVIYYTGNELPNTADNGGAHVGRSGRSGGREARHPTQTIRVARGEMLREKVVDAPNLKLPHSDAAVANLLAYKRVPGPPPAEGLKSSRAPMVAPQLTAVPPSPDRRSQPDAERARARRRRGSASSRRRRYRFAPPSRFAPGRGGSASGLRPGTDHQCQSTAHPAGAERGSSRAHRGHARTIERRTRIRPRGTAQASGAPAGPDWQCQFARTSERVRLRERGGRASARADWRGRFRRTPERLRARQLGGGTTAGAARLGLAFPPAGERTGRRRRRRAPAPHGLRRLFAQRPRTGQPGHGPRRGGRCGRGGRSSELRWKRKSGGYRGFEPAGIEGGGAWIWRIRVACHVSLGRRESRPGRGRGRHF